MSFWKCTFGLHKLSRNLLVFLDPYFQTDVGSAESTMQLLIHNKFGLTWCSPKISCPAVEADLMCIVNYNFGLWKLKLFFFYLCDYIFFHACIFYFSFSPLCFRLRVALSAVHTREDLENLAAALSNCINF